MWRYVAPVHIQGSVLSQRPQHHLQLQQVNHIPREAQDSQGLCPHPKQKPMLGTEMGFVNQHKGTLKLHQHSDFSFLPCV